mmetsp:Transcript_13382/g.30814  ORF Transcript_13382/g.30814 Transcript_13382/m.30814 type:complete len:89 (+) Transcript_13382:251-517(+)
MDTESLPVRSVQQRKGYLFSHSALYPASARRSAVPKKKLESLPNKLSSGRKTGLATPAVNLEQYALATLETKVGAEFIRGWLKRTVDE